jgi:hypothetical protein
MTLLMYFHTSVLMVCQLEAQGVRVWQACYGDVVWQSRMAVLYGNLAMAYHENFTCSSTLTQYSHPSPSCS